MSVDTVALLLADRSPALRRRALVEVDGIDPADPEVVALDAEVPGSAEVQRALAAVPAVQGDRTQTSFLLSRLAFLGVRRGHPGVDGLAEELLAEVRDDGSWPNDLGWGGDEALPPKKGVVRPPDEGYRWRVLQTALPLRGLAEAGWATDERCEAAYRWILDRRLDDGTFPYGLLHGRTKTSGVVGYRRLPGSEGCRATTTGVLLCLTAHPNRATSDDARRGLDHLLARETRDEWALGFELSRLLGVERARGFATFFARFDLAVVLGLAGRIGAGLDDDRVRDLVAFLESRRGPLGLWEHRDHPHLSRWLTVDLLASLRRVGQGEWSGSDRRLDFRPYPRGRRRH